MPEAGGEGRAVSLSLPRRNNNGMVLPDSLIFYENPGIQIFKVLELK